MDTSGRKKKKDGTEKKKPGPKQGQKQVMRDSFKSRGKGKRTILTIGQKLEVMEKMEQNGWSQQKAAERFSRQWDQAEQHFSMVQTAQI
jgi:hypothetical protein